MNDYLLSLVLGIVEGLTEFLPVSSTAHIRIAQALLQGEASLKSGYWKMFAVLIQLPAILAVVVFFRVKILELVKTFAAGGMNKAKLNHPIVLVAIATVVTVIPVAIAKRVVKEHLESLYIIGAALLIGGVVMYLVDTFVRKVNTKSLEQIKPWQAAWIGAVQVLSAIFPGTSRSMATIAGGQVAGLDRPTALEFSFFLSIPIMCIACAKDAWDSIKAKPGTEDYVGHLGTSQLAQLGIGSVTSFVVALAVIAWFMGWVRKRGFTPFAIYRVVLGIAVLAWAFSSHR